MRQEWILSLAKQNVSQKAAYNDHVNFYFCAVVFFSAHTKPWKARRTTIPKPRRKYPIPASVSGIMKQPIVLGFRVCVCVHAWRSGPIPTPPKWQTVASIEKINLPHFSFFHSALFNRWIDGDIVQQITTGGFESAEMEYDTPTWAGSGCKRNVTVFQGGVNLTNVCLGAVKCTNEKCRKTVRPASSMARIEQ
ncbi:uncharacterized protein BYT42DRAFT_308599 [Radiomyces spectabilis]|uniref:uncharacterized protein n=1 Tax=Radiomyces spectabilis TaxID=64574 RepID=UPI0022205622|nr:uncharacterized protein BYT42DRAFT_308599 [Radiomyces spectabilis]KAI8381534.1 hypothetical protein BYT42DRAFT_308599 [Radiomyces spectabilis]